MEVTCSRCQSVYDFEDTLVSPKGVVVRCTHCGHLFKIFPAGAEPAAAEESGWMLRREDGTVFAIDRFSTLQKWIAQGKVTRRDELSRTGETWKRMGEIVELTPFFETVEKQAAAGRADPTVVSGPVRPDRDSVPPPAGDRLEIPSAYESTIPGEVVTPPSVPPDETPKAARPPKASAEFEIVEETAAFRVEEPVRADAETVGIRPMRRPVVPPGEARFSADFDDAVSRRRGWVWILLLAIAVIGGTAGGIFRQQIMRFFEHIFSGDEESGTASERILARAGAYLAEETSESFEQAEDEYARLLKFNVGDTRALGGLLEVRTVRAQYARDELDIALLLGMGAREPRQVDRLRAAFDTEVAKARELALSIVPTEGDVGGLGPEAVRALADLERLRGDRDRAQSLIARALSAAPDDPRALYVQAMVIMDEALSSQDLAGAVAEVEAAFGRALAAPGGRDALPRARIHLAVYLAIAGRRDEAAAQVRCVIDGGATCPGGAGTPHRDHVVAGKVEAWLSLLPSGITGPIPPELPSYTVGAPSPAEIEVGEDAGAQVPDAGDIAADAGAADVDDAPEAGQAAEAVKEAEGEVVDAKPEAGVRDVAPPEMPTSVEGLLEAAQEALEYGGTQRAITLLQQALRLSPNDVEALVNLGYAYLDIGRRPEARQQFERANRISGGHPDALLGLGDILVGQGSLEAALDAYRGALERSRNPRQQRMAERKVRDLEERLGRATPPDVGGAPTPAPAPAPAPTPTPTPTPPYPGPVSDTPAVGSEPPGLPPVTEP